MGTNQIQCSDTSELQAARRSHTPFCCNAPVNHTHFQAVLYAVQFTEDLMCDMSSHFRFLWVNASSPHKGFTCECGICQCGPGYDGDDCSCSPATDQCVPEGGERVRCRNSSALPKCLQYIASLPSMVCVLRCVSDNLTQVSDAVVVISILGFTVNAP